MPILACEQQSLLFLSAQEMFSPQIEEHSTKFNHRKRVSLRLFELQNEVHFDEEFQNSQQIKLLIF